MAHNNKIYNKLYLFSKLDKNDIYNQNIHIDFKHLTMKDIVLLPFMYRDNSKFINLRDRFIGKFYKNYISNNVTYCKNNLYYCILINILETCRKQENSWNYHFNGDEDLPLIKVNPIFDIQPMDIFKENINESDIFFDVKLKRKNLKSKFNLDIVTQKNYVSRFINKYYSGVFEDENGFDDVDLDVLAYHFCTMGYIMEHHYLELKNVFEFVYQQQQQQQQQQKPISTVLNCRKRLDFLVNNVYSSFKRPREGLLSESNINKRKRMNESNIDYYDDDDDDIEICDEEVDNSLA